MSKRFISWKEYQETIYSILPTLKSMDINCILAIGTGGFTPAQHLSYLLSKNNDHLPMEVAMVNHYSGDQLMENVHIKYLSQNKFDTVLIVDDVYETGDTIREVIRNIEANYIEVAVLFGKTKEPTYFHFGKICSSKEWLVMPWEVQSDNPPCCKCGKEASVYYCPRCFYEII